MVLRKVPLSSLLLVLILTSGVLLTGALLFAVRQESGEAAVQSAQLHFKEIASKTIAEVGTIVASITAVTDTAALIFSGDPGPDADRDLAAMRAILDDNSQILSCYVGYPDGRFHQLIAPRGNGHILAAYDAPANAAYIDRIIALGADGTRRQSWRFLDEGLNLLTVRKDAAVSFDPRQRPWYLDAQAARDATYTAPYVFSSSRLPGITCARLLADQGGVFGVDVSLAQLGDMLAAQRVTSHGTLWIVDQAGRLVAHPGQPWEKLVGDSLTLPLAAASADPVVRDATHAASAPGGDGPRLTDIDGKPYLAAMAAMPGDEGLGLRVVVAAPLSDITGHIDRMASRIVLVAAAILLALFPLALFLARRVARPVGLLCREAEKIQRLDFSPSPEIRTHVAEVQALASACEVMKSTIRAKTESLLDTQARLEMLVSGGLALADEKDMARLVTLIFQTAQTLAKADGGVLYLLEGEELGVELLSLHAESLVLGGLSGNPAPRVKVRPAIMPFLSPASVLRPACEAMQTRLPVSARDTDLTMFPTGLPEEPTGCRIASHLTIPLMTRRNEMLGVLQLFNPELPGPDAADGTAMDRFIASLAAQAAVALDNHNLVNSLRRLFDALIQVIASSIDAKSPYTAGHCTRVPVLTEMLARAVHETGDGPLRDFRIETDDDWRQLWIASWLHDCGKVTTPEYVVDKATKLETIYNRIHEVRMRFEVLRRDAEIRLLRESGCADHVTPQRRQAFEEELRGLDDDFAFVAACNMGGEFLDDQAAARLSRIAQRTWLRCYSDRIGVSDEELRGRSATPEPGLPTPEQLLSDKPEHIVPRARTYPGLRDAHGDLLPIPEHEYNRGEFYNLRIPRGTLTPEERFKINEHMLCGLEMLRQIPFPAQLGRVTEIAAGHHETLTGTGYPLKKTKDQLPVEARILAVADIFEALTASDRPYKKAKSVAEALRIMSRMRDDSHIDADIFDIFLTRGVFRIYAENHLDPSQCDVTDVTPYLSQINPA